MPVPIAQRRLRPSPVYGWWTNRGRGWWWRDALEAIGGFDTSIEFHGEDTNLARRISKAGRVRLRQPCWVFTSARRYKMMGGGKVFGLYVRNFCAEIFFHRPSDTTHEDVRARYPMPGYEPYLLCDFHVHTAWSDGRLTLREVVDLYGQTEKFDVLAITDHILAKRSA